MKRGSIAVPASYALDAKTLFNGFCFIYNTN